LVIPKRFRFASAGLHKTNKIRDMPKTSSPLDDKVAFLGKHPIFHEIDREALSQLCHYAKTRKFRKGALVFSKGDPGDRLLVVMSGTVKIGISAANGRSTIFNLVGAGELFGEIAFLDGSPRTADAIANSACEILAFDKRDFWPFMQGQPVLLMKFIELLCTRLRWVSEHVEQIGLPDLQTRLAKTLIRLGERDPSAAKTGKVAVTQQELSEMIGMSRESINRQLRAWVALGWVRLGHGAIVVLNVSPLKVIAAEDDAGPGNRR
jgi:CRP/FNR family transcriptional regulator, cyclic AMP receptor protein